MSLDGTRIFVTGGHGFIGRRVVPLLVASGADVVSAYRPGQRWTELPGRQVEIDLRDRQGLAARMSGVDLVIHLAATSGGIQLQESIHSGILQENFAMSSNVLAAAATAGVRRVFLASSAVVYGGEPHFPIPEAAPVLSPGDHPSGYAWSKITDEVVAGWYQQESSFETVVGRFTNVFGPGGSFDPARSTVVHALVRRALDVAPQGPLTVWGDGTAVRSFVFVEDAARAVVTILAAGVPGEAYNIGGGEPTSIADLATAIRDLVSPAMELLFDPSRPAGVHYRAVDGSKLASIGFTPAVGLIDGLRATIEAARLAEPGRSQG
jgi:GDP-L-fucose synthase